MGTPVPDPDPHGPDLRKRQTTGVERDRSADVDWDMVMFCTGKTSFQARKELKVRDGMVHHLHLGHASRL